jgi:hypothetical protein
VKGVTAELSYWVENYGNYIKSSIHLMDGIWEKWQIKRMMNGVAGTTGEEAICPVLRYGLRLKNRKGL